MVCYTVSASVHVIAHCYVNTHTHTQKEELVRKEKQEQRALKKQQEKEAKGKPRGFLFPTYETVSTVLHVLLLCGLYSGLSYL